MASEIVSTQPSATNNVAQDSRNSSSNNNNNNDGISQNRRRCSATSSNYSQNNSEKLQKERCICCCSPRGKQVRRCCCVGETDKDGDDFDAWNYPWDKGFPKCVGLCCMWYAFCLVFPCSLCLPPYRDLLCCVKEGCWDGTCCGACLFGLPPPGSRPRPHGNRSGSRVSHWSDSS